MKEMEEK